MAWFLHHLDLIDHYFYQFTKLFIKKSKKMYKNLYRSVRLMKMGGMKTNFDCDESVFTNQNYNLFKNFFYRK